METKLKSTDRPIAIYYAFHSDVNSVTKIGGSKCQINLNVDWNLINTTIGTIKFEENPQNINAGRYYHTKISASIPGEDENSPENTMNISGRPVILRVEYKSGRSKIVGHADKGPKMYISTTSNNSTIRTITSSFENTEANRWLQ